MKMKEVQNKKPRPVAPVRPVRYGREQLVGHTAMGCARGAIRCFVQVKK